MRNNIKKITELLALFSTDISTILFVFELAVLIRKILPLIFHQSFPSHMPLTSLDRLWWILLVWCCFLWYEGLYTRAFSFWDEIKALCKVSVFSTAGVFTIVSIGKLGEEISRTVIILMGFISFFVLPFERILMKKLLRKAGLLRRRVLILGAGETGRIIVRALRREPNYGYDVIGFLDDDTAKVGGKIEGVKVHRGVYEASGYLKRCGVTDLFIAMPGAGKEKLQRLINDLQHKVERILFVPDMFSIAVLGTGLKHFFQEEVLAFEIENNLLNPFNFVIKKIFDLSVSLVGLVLLLVPMAVMSVFIRLDSAGPAIFAQERVGKNGRLFRCFKFRTMYCDAEERLGLLLQKDPEVKKKWEQYWKLNEDPRVTRVGRFLRMTSLDELPQLYNVLKGEMSLVGPRPYLPKEKDILGEYSRTILLTTPGITGLWQVSGRSNTSHEFRITLDLWYVRNWNLWLDIIILFKTVRIVLLREGAY